MTREEMLKRLVEIYENSSEAVTSFIKDYYNYKCPQCGLAHYKDSDLEAELKEIDETEDNVE